MKTFGRSSMTSGGDVHALTDTSVAVPLLLASHAAHTVARAAADKYSLSLATHSLAETYSVLTRLPGAAGNPADVVRAIDEAFPHIVEPSRESSRAIHRVFAEIGVAGGAVYDALIALAAVEGGLPVVTRDRRAAPTYRALGATAILIPASAADVGDPP